MEGQAEVVRRMFHMCVHEGMGSRSIAVRLTDGGIPTQTGKPMWRQSYVHHVLGMPTTRAPESTASPATSPPRTV